MFSPQAGVRYPSPRRRQCEVECIRSNDEQSERHPRAENVDKTLDTVASSVLSNVFGPRRRALSSPRRRQRGSWNASGPTMNRASGAPGWCRYFERYAIEPKHWMTKRWTLAETVNTRTSNVSPLMPSTALPRFKAASKTLDAQTLNTERRVYWKPAIQLLVEVMAYACVCRRCSAASERTTQSWIMRRRRRSRSFRRALRTQQFIRFSEVFNCSLIIE